MEAALAVEKVGTAVEGMKIVKTILVKNRLVNLIVKPLKHDCFSTGEHFLWRKTGISEKILDNLPKAPYNIIVNAIFYGP